MDNEAVWLCEQCAKVYTAAGNCAVHLDEPLLDVRTEAVVLALVALDDNARDAALSRWMLLLGGAGMLVSGLLLLAATGARVEPPALVFLIPPFLGAMAGRAIGRQRDRPRFRQWTSGVDLQPDGEIQALGDSMGPRLRDQAKL